jgi:hypothetical protein
MSDPLDEVLRLVAQGHLTAEEAAPVIDALQAYGAATDDGSNDETSTADAGGAGPTGGGSPRALRIEVAEGGRRVVNLRVPLSLGRMAIDRVPGLSNDNIDRIREALDHGMTGPILVVDEGEGGSGVRIVIE